MSQKKSMSRGQRKHKARMKKLANAAELEKFVLDTTGIQMEPWQTEVADGVMRMQLEPGLLASVGLPPLGSREELKKHRDEQARLFREQERMAEVREMEELRKIESALILQANSNPSVGTPDGYMMENSYTEMVRAQQAAMKNMQGPSVLRPIITGETAWDAHTGEILRKPETGTKPHFSSSPEV